MNIKEAVLEIKDHPGLFIRPLSWKEEGGWGISVYQDRLYMGPKMNDKRMWLEGYHQHILSVKEILEDWEVISLETLLTERSKRGI